MQAPKLSQVEKSYNDWWMKQFDADEYKMIAIYNHGHKLDEYTTANKRYSNQEDLACAIFTAKHFGIMIDRVDIDGQQYRVSKKTYRKSRC